MVLHQCGAEKGSVPKWKREFWEAATRERQVRKERSNRKKGEAISPQL